MKKILFVIPSMEIGGTRSSLVNLLHNLRDANLNVDLFIIRHEGILLSQIPQYVHILPEVKMAAFAMPNTKRNSVLSGLYHLVIALLNRIYGYKSVYRFIYKVWGGDLFQIGNNYDAVIAYQEGVSVYTSSLIPADQHIIWIHSDVDIWYDKRAFEKDAFDNANNIIFVAENTKKLFCDKFPQYASKCRIIKNTLNKEAIFEKANVPMTEDSEEGLSLLSIGRFTEAKAFDRVILASEHLKSKGYKFTWTLLGDGELFSSMKQMAVEHHVDDVIRFMGAQSNPFAYIKNSDVVVVSSVNESQPMVILESLTLSKPVVSTGFESAKEVLQNGEYGLICQNDTDEFIAAVESMFTDPSILEDLRKSAAAYEYDNRSIVNQLIDIL